MNLLKKGLLGAALFALVSVMPLWAVWEGNAGIASSVEFPGSGNFAKSDMFPKNTIVEILNLETNIKIRAVITGASGVPGLVAMLSPEAAAALNVKSGSVSRVRISVPSPVSEVPAPGTLSGGGGARTVDPDANPESAAIVADSLASSTAAAAPPVAVTGAGARPEALAAIAAPSDDPLVNMENGGTETETAAEDIPAAETPAVAEVPETVETAQDPAPERMSGIIAAADPSAPVFETPGVAEAPEAPEPAASTSMYDEPELMVSDTPAPTESPETVTAVTQEPEFGVEPDVPPVTDELTETVVTLEPAEMLPPPALPAEIEAVPELADVTAPPIEMEPKLEMPAEPPVPEVPAVTLSPDATVRLGNLPLISSLEKGKYYVQIASYAETGNIYTVLKTWSDKYPMAVERSAAKGKEIYKVYVGPITRDEYGAVLERFKAAGYRDSFVKKGS